MPDSSKLTIPCVVGTYVKFNRKQFEAGYKIVKAQYGFDVRQAEVLIEVNGEQFETSFDDLERALLSLRKTQRMITK